MRRSLVLQLDDCTDFRRIQLAKPRPLAHGAVTLLAGLLVAALVWMATTKADLIVVATGRVRPTVEPDRIFSGEQFNAATGGRVTEVAYREGHEVHAGDLLIRFDTGHLDNQIRKTQEHLTAAHQVWDQLKRLEVLLASQFQARRQHAQSQLDQAIRQVERAKQERSVNIHVAQLQLENARYRLEKTQNLRARHAAAPEEVHRADLDVQQAQAQLVLAKLPVDETNIHVRTRQRETLVRAHDVQRQDLKLKQTAKQAQMNQLRLDLKGFRLQHRQAEIRSTVAGIVISKELNVGDVIRAGQPLVEIAPVDGYRMDVALTSQDIGELTVGMPARIKLDAYDYQQYGTLEGKVVFVSPDSQPVEGKQGVAPPLYTARLALANREVSRGQRRGRLKLGMTGRVEIITRRENLLSVLLRRIRRTISLG